MDNQTLLLTLLQQALYRFSRRNLDRATRERRLLMFIRVFSGHKLKIQWPFDYHLCVGGRAQYGARGLRARMARFPYSVVGRWQIFIGIVCQESERPDGSKHMWMLINDKGRILLYWSKHDRLYCVDDFNELVMYGLTMVSMLYEGEYDPVEDKTTMFASLVNGVMKPLFEGPLWEPRDVLDFLKTHENHRFNGNPGWFGLHLGGIETLRVYHHLPEWVWGELNRRNLVLIARSYSYKRLIFMDMEEGGIYTVIGPQFLVKLAESIRGFLRQTVSNLVDLTRVAFRPVCLRKAAAGEWINIKTGANWAQPNFSGEMDSWVHEARIKWAKKRQGSHLG